MFCARKQPGTPYLKFLEPSTVLPTECQKSDPTAGNDMRVHNFMYINCIHFILRP